MDSVEMNGALRGLLRESLQFTNNIPDFQGVPVANFVQGECASSKSVQLSEEFIKGLLTRDFISRKTRQWRLLNEEEMAEIYLQTAGLRDLPWSRIDCDLFSVGRRVPGSVYQPQHNSYKALTTRTIDSIEEWYPLTTKLLENFHGKLVAAGGAIFKATDGIHPPDIDFFFVDPEVEKKSSTEDYDQLLKDAVNFLIRSWFALSTFTKNRHAYIARSQYTTTVYLCDEGDKKYQFIHRVYPSVESILGGFDLGPAMIAYTGRKIVATELGAWSAFSKVLIVDVSRRSTSFEARLSKYAIWCSLIFPGLRKNSFLKQSGHWKREEEIPDFIDEVITEYGYRFISQDCNGNSYNPRCRSYVSSGIKGLLVKPEAEYSKEEVLDMLLDLASERGYRIENEIVLVDERIDDPEKENVSLEELEIILKKRCFDVGYIFNLEDYLEQRNQEVIKVHFPPRQVEAPKIRYLKKRAMIARLPKLWINLKEAESAYYYWNIKSRYDNAQRFSRNDRGTEDTRALSRKGMESDYDDNDAWPLYLAYNNSSALSKNQLGAVTSLLLIKDVKCHIEEEYPSYGRDRKRIETALEVMNGCSVQLTKETREELKTIIDQWFGEVQIGDYDKSFQSICDRFQKKDDSFFNVHCFKLYVKNHLEEYSKEILEAINAETHAKKHPNFRPSAYMTDLMLKVFNLLAERMHRNAEIAKKNLERITWITKNPGRQWTSSINPVIKDPREWYGQYYTRFVVGDEALESTLRLMRKVKGCLWSMLDVHVFNYIVRLILWNRSYFYAGVKAKA